LINTRRGLLLVILLFVAMIASHLDVIPIWDAFGDMVRDVRPRPGSVLLMGNAIYNFPPEVDGRSDALTAEPSRPVPYFVAIGDVTRDVLQSHIHRDGELFFYMAFANADNEQLPNLTTKQYERYGYTLALSTFRFTFTP
jgi:hypothetical protein